MLHSGTWFRPSPGTGAGHPGGGTAVLPTLESDVVRLALAAALGLFLGLEREWSHKSAGVRTFALISLTVAVFTADWSRSVEMSLDSPFSLRNALTGLVSSAGATTSAVLLYRGGAIGATTATAAILAATAASIAIKAGLTAAGPDRRFASRVAVWSGVVPLLGGVGVTVLVA